MTTKPKKVTALRKEIMDSKDKKRKDFGEIDRDNMVIYLSLVKQIDVYGHIIKPTDFPHIQRQINGSRIVSAELIKHWNTHIINMYKQRGIEYSEDEFWDLSANITSMIRAYILNPELMMQSTELALNPDKYPFPEVAAAPSHALDPIENNEN